MDKNYEAPEIQALGTFAEKTGEGIASTDEWGWPQFDWVYSSLG